MNVWIVEDDAGYRRNLRLSLEMEDDVEVSRVFPSCLELFDALTMERMPDVVLMDLGLPGMSGTAAIRELSRVAPEIAVVVLTVFKEKKKVDRALKAGAAGYLLKASDGPQIAEGLRAVLAGQAVMSPSLSSL